MNYSKFDLEVQEKRSFKDISYIDLWCPFYSTQWNHLFNFCKNHYEEQFCKIINSLKIEFGRVVLENMSFKNKFEPVVQEDMSFKVFLI